MLFYFIGENVIKLGKINGKLWEKGFVKKRKRENMSFITFYN